MSDLFGKPPGSGGPIDWESLFADTPAQKSADIDWNALFGIVGTSPFTPRSSLHHQTFAAALAGLPLLSEYRSRASWNERFEHWSRPASVSEEGTILRAQSNVRAALSSNRWLREQGVSVLPQGSYHNNTNVRTEADIDLRVEHPYFNVGHDTNISFDHAFTSMGYESKGISFTDLFSRMRSEVAASLGQAFGKASIDIGNKAIRVKGITGSRAEVDVVPMVGYRHIYINNYRNYSVLNGVAIFSNSGRWTQNFPEQHYANGVLKRSKTAHRFKRIVRIFKRLRSDMEERGIAAAKVPSFLVECLVYLVDDWYFKVEADDIYGRIRRIALQLQQLFTNPAVAATYKEINDIKYLFHADQAWTQQQARAFIDAVVTHLGDA